MKYILFLGGNGFLGKNVTDGYLNQPQPQEPIHFIITGRGFDKKNLPDNALISYYELDFSNKEGLRQLFEKYPVAEVFHFISSTTPSNSNENMAHDIQINLIGTVGLLELMQEFGVKKITYISSGGAIYGDTPANNSHESDFNNPNNSYGIVKLATEKYIMLFHKLYGMEYLILRLSNPFGKFHTNNRNGFINIAMRKALKNEPVVIWGDGLQTKDYIFSGDFSKIFWNLYYKKIKNLILNIGSGRLYSLLDLLENIKILIPDLNWTHESAKSFDTKKVAFSLDSLKQIMPVENTDFLDALRVTLSWEKEQMEGGN